MMFVAKNKRHLGMAAHSFHSLAQLPIDGRMVPVPMAQIRAATEIRQTAPEPALASPSRQSAPESAPLSHESISTASLEKQILRQDFAQPYKI